MSINYSFPCKGSLSVSFPDDTYWNYSRINGGEDDLVCLSLNEINDIITQMQSDFETKGADVPIWVKDVYNALIVYRDKIENECVEVKPEENKEELVIKDTNGEVVCTYSIHAIEDSQYTISLPHYELLTIASLNVGTKELLLQLLSTVECWLTTECYTEMSDRIVAGDFDTESYIYYLMDLRSRRYWDKYVANTRSYYNSFIGTGNVEMSISGNYADAE